MENLYKNIDKLPEEQRITVLYINKISMGFQNYCPKNKLWY